MSLVSVSYLLAESVVLFTELNAHTNDPSLDWLATYRSLIDGWMDWLIDWLVHAVSLRSPKLGQTSCMLSPYYGALFSTPTGHIMAHRFFCQSRKLADIPRNLCINLDPKLLGGASSAAWPFPGVLDVCFLMVDGSSLPFRDFFLPFVDFQEVVYTRFPLQFFSSPVNFETCVTQD